METLVKDVTRDDLARIAQEVLTAVTLRSCAHATVVSLLGDVGAGKTTFTQEIARLLGVAEDVTSPTFVIMKHYRVAHPVFKTLTHIDAYRIEVAQELLVLGFEELLRDKERLIVIEWGERVKEVLPHDVYTLRFTHVREGVRRIEKLYA